MKYNIKFCNNCYKNKNSLAPENTSEYYAGYMVCMKADKLANMTKCPLCGKEGLVETNITEEELDLMGEASNYNRHFLEAMIDLKQKNVIEYELKMSQFRSQVGQQKQQEQVKQESNSIRCPYCHSTNVKKISTTSRAASAMVFGIISKKIGKQWHCDNCKSDF